MNISSELFGREPVATERGNSSLRVDGLAVDFDGVIVDSMEAQERAWRNAVREVIRHPGKRKRVWNQIYRNLYSGAAGERMLAGVDVTPIERRKLRALKDEHWRRLSEGVELRYGVRTILPQLARRLPIAIATTADREYVERVLRRAGLLEQIDLILTDRDVEEPKPSPAMLRSIAESFGISENKLLMVGDSATDAEMAHAAGVPLFLMRTEAGNADLRKRAVDVGRWRKLRDLVVHGGGTSSSIRRAAGAPG